MTSRVTTQVNESRYVNLFSKLEIRKDKSSTETFGTCFFFRYIYKNKLQNFSSGLFSDLPSLSDCKTYFVLSRSSLSILTCIYLLNVGSLNPSLSALNNLPLWLKRVELSKYNLRICFVICNMI